MDALSGMSADCLLRRSRESTCNLVGVGTTIVCIMFSGLDSLIPFSQLSRGLKTFRPYNPELSLQMSFNQGPLTLFQQLVLLLPHQPSGG